MNLDPTQLIAFAQRYTAAWCSNDPAQVAAFFSHNGSLKVNDAPPSVGRTAIAEVARYFISAFPDLHLKMDNLLIQNDRAIYHWTFSGSNIGPGGIGHKVLFSGFENWRFGADGLIAESLGLFDENEYRLQVQHGT